MPEQSVDPALTEDLASPNLNSSGNLDEHERKVPMSGKIAFGMGCMADNLISNSILGLMLPIYNIGLGVSPVAVSWAMGLPRFWDAIADPLMGNISDNTRSRWGRRRPYIALGALLSGIFFALMWNPPAVGKTGLFAYLLGISVLYFTAYAIFFVPLTGLSLELSTDYNERTRIMAYKTFFSAVGGLIIPWLYWLCFRPEFGHNAVEGVRVVGLLVGALIIASGILPAFFCRENMAVQSQPKIDLWQAFLYTFRNRAFLLLAGVVATLLIGLWLVQPFQAYINIYHVYGGDKKAAAGMIGLAGTIYSLAGMLASPFVSYFGTRWRKKQVLLAGQTMVILSFLSTWFLFNPKYPSLQIIVMLLMSPGFTCIWVLTASMLADVCDVDELSSGLRREGMYGAVFSWIFKVGIAGVMVVSGYLLTWSGFNSTPGAQQSPHTIQTLRLFFALVPSSFLALSMALTLLYPITEQRARAVRAQLDERKRTARQPTAH